MIAEIIKCVGIAGCVNSTAVDGAGDIVLFFGQVIAQVVSGAETPFGDTVDTARLCPVINEFNVARDAVLLAVVVKCV